MKNVEVTCDFLTLWAALLLRNRDEISLHILTMCWNVITGYSTVEIQYHGNILLMMGNCKQRAVK